MLLAASSAAADEGAPASKEEMVPLPFTLTDKPDGTSGGGLDLALSHFPDSDGVFGLRVDGHLQYFQPSGAGYYSRMLFTSAFGEGDSVAGVGNLELGGAYAKRIGQLAFVLRGGATVPIASDGADGTVSNLLNLTGGIADFSLIVPEASFARLSASGIVHGGNVFARADIGFDVPVWHSDNIDPDTLTHVNLGLGFTTKPGGTAFLAEYSNLSGLGSSLSAFSLGAGFRNGSSVSLVKSLDEDFLGDVYVLKVGIRFGGGSDSKETRGAVQAMPSEGISPGCTRFVAEWRAENKDFVRKTRLYDDMPEVCQQEVQVDESDLKKPPATSPAEAAPPAPADAPESDGESESDDSEPAVDSESGTPPAEPAPAEPAPAEPAPAEPAPAEREESEPSAP
jgi:hypothetical protein